MPYPLAIPVAAAIVSAWGSGLQARSTRKALRKQKSEILKALRELEPEQITRSALKFRPMFREAMFPQASSLRQTVARNVERSGLASSPAGVGALDAAAVAPEFEAFKLALDRASNIAALRANLHGVAASMIQPAPNVAASAIAGGARGFFAAYPNRQANAAPNASTGGSIFPYTAPPMSPIQPNIYQSFMPNVEEFRYNNG